MAKRILNKELLKEIQELRKVTKKQMGLGLMSVAVAYILVGISLKTYSTSGRDFVSVVLVFMGLLGIAWVFLRDSFSKQKDK